jgi:hypothetical protein
MLISHGRTDGSRTQSFDACEWLAAMCSHVPNKGEQMASYYGYYSNASRGKRKKARYDNKIACIIEPEVPDKAFRRNWARLVQKIYEVDPLACPKCASPMKVIAFIEDEYVTRKILKHLGLWELKRKPPPRANASPVSDVSPYDESSVPSVDDSIIDPQYPVEAYFDSAR